MQPENMPYKTEYRVEQWYDETSTGKYGTFTYHGWYEAHDVPDLAAAEAEANASKRPARITEITYRVIRQDDTGGSEHANR